MPFRERLKSIVKGETPVFGHFRHRQASESHQDGDRRHSEAGPARESNLPPRGHNLGRRPGDKGDERRAVQDSRPAYSTQEHARTPEDNVRGRGEVGGITGERREGGILKDTLRERGDEHLRQHQEALVRNRDRYDTGGGGHDADRRAKAPPPPPPPPTTAPGVPQRPVERTAAAAARHVFSQGGATSGEGHFREGRPRPTRDLRYDLPIPYGPRQERLEVTQGGVIQNQQAIRESMAIDDSGRGKPGQVYASRQGYNRPALSRHLSDETQYRRSVPNTERLGRAQTTAESKQRGQKSTRSRSYDGSMNEGERMPKGGDHKELTSKGALYNVPPPSPEEIKSSKPSNSRAQEDVYVTEGPSGYSASARTTGQGQGQGDRILTDTPFDKDLRTRKYIAPAVMEGAGNTGDKSSEYSSGKYKLSSGGRSESSAEAYIPRTAHPAAETSHTISTPAMEYHIPLPVSPEESHSREREDQESRDRLKGVGTYGVKEREYTSHLPITITTTSIPPPPPSTASTSITHPSSSPQYSTLHNILPPAYEVDPEEGPFHRSLELGGRSSSVLSNRSDICKSNLREWGLDPMSEVYEITNFGGGRMAPVMGVEEEGEWYKDDPVRGGCFCKGGEVRWMEGEHGRRVEMLPREVEEH